jgi:hypothetical protein
VNRNAQHRNPHQGPSRTDGMEYVRFILYGVTPAAYRQHMDALMQGTARRRPMSYLNVHSGFWETYWGMTPRRVHAAPVQPRSPGLRVIQGGAL